MGLGLASHAWAGMAGMGSWAHGLGCGKWAGLLVRVARCQLDGVDHFHGWAGWPWTSVWFGCCQPAVSPLFPSTRRRLRPRLCPREPTGSPREQAGGVGWATAIGGFARRVPDWRCECRCVGVRSSPRPWGHGSPHSRLRQNMADNLGSRPRPSEIPTVWTAMG